MGWTLTLQGTFTGIVSFHLHDFSMTVCLSVLWRWLREKEWCAQGHTAQVAELGVSLYTLGFLTCRRACEFPFQLQVHLLPWDQSWSSLLQDLILQLYLPHGWFQMALTQVCLLLSIPLSAKSPVIRLFGSWWPRQRQR